MLAIRFTLRNRLALAVAFAILLLIGILIEPAHPRVASWLQTISSISFFCLALAMVIRKRGGLADRE
jgi:hypothetical protein